MRELPTGTVTFLFTDVEGSTRLLQEYGERYGELLARHQRVLREAFARHGGVEVDTQGDAFFVAFASAREAVVAARDAQEALGEGPVRVRMGVHTGEATVTEEGYVGIDVHRAARIAAAAHGGQVVLSRATRDLIEADVVDLGDHRLKDLSAPERLFQLGEGTFPRLRTLYLTNLPIPATQFLGRETELREVTRLLAQGEVRLLTLTGAGGTGKTRLALQAVAAAAEDYPDGVWWVPLAALRDHELVLSTVAQALGAEEAVASQVGDRRLLLLLDNFEQVIRAAPGVAELLSSCARLEVVVTSRELLRVAGEQAYPVPPLNPGDGKELFVARARAAVPSFVESVVVGELCGELDNLPLAIELAAARVRVLSPEQLLARLSQRLDLLRGGRDADPRQQTLRATIEWSYDLLPSEEQRLFASLAVFAGGCTLQAAEEICDANLDTLTSLVDKSLVRQSDERFWMLETIREFAVERLDESRDVAELRRRHATHFVTFAEQMGGVHQGGRRLHALEAERANLRAALGWLGGHGEAALELRLAVALREFWLSRGPLSEGRAWLQDALTRTEEPRPLRVKALLALGWIAMKEGDTAQWMTLLQESLTLARALNDLDGVAFALRDLATASARGGDWLAHDRYIEESIEVARELGNQGVLAGIIHNAGYVAGVRGDYARAKVKLEESLAIARRLEDPLHISMALLDLGQLAFLEGRKDEATSLLANSLRVAHDYGDIPVSLDCLGALAAVAAAEGDTVMAARVLGAVEALRAPIGTDLFIDPIERDLHERATHAVRAHLEPSELEAASAEGRAMSLDDAVAYALKANGIR